MKRKTSVRSYERRDGTKVSAHDRTIDASSAPKANVESYKPPVKERRLAQRTQRGEQFIRLAFPDHEDDFYLEEQRKRLTREPWTWYDFDNRRILKKVYPERYAHLPVEHNLYIERYNRPEDWNETPRFDSYARMIEYITIERKGLYIGYTEFMDGTWIGYYKLKAVDKIKSREDARNYAIDYQNWASNQNLSYGEIAEHQAELYALGKRFGLVKEFRENGLI